ncbi:MAG: glycosyltransferase family 2 protein [Desulfovibrio sp.]|nr:glycosyltransferase family 2 protein [Desulfovibrio sp.]
MQIPLYPLQNIVLSPERAELTPLFLKEELESFSTRTYVNMFASCLWRYYTELEDFYLRLTAKGNGWLYIHALDKNFAPLETERIAVVEGELVVQLQDAAYTYLTWEKSAQLLSAAYCSKNPMANKVKLLCVMPTYNRVAYAEKNVLNFERIVAKWSFLRGHVRLLVINNGSESDFFTSPCADVEIVHNSVNRGGSAAFIFGAKYALDGGWSHAVFMDDDAQPLQESFFRTYMLLSYLRPENAKYFITGSMFTFESPLDLYAFSESVDQDFELGKYRKGQDRIDQTEGVKRFFCAVEKELDERKENIFRYAGWWYCVIPSLYFKMGEFPFDFFFIGDDIEYSIRLKPDFIVLNGICTWHPSFKNKKTIIRRYLSTRNKFLIWRMHLNISRKITVNFVLKRIKSLLYKHNWNAYIDLLAIYDFCKIKQKLNNDFNYIKKKLSLNLYDSYDALPPMNIMRILYVVRHIPFILYYLFKFKK